MVPASWKNKFRKSRQSTRSGKNLVRGQLVNLAVFQSVYTLKIFILKIKK
jgi:hypothetical protein